MYFTKEEKRLAHMQESRLYRVRHPDKSAEARKKWRAKNPRKVKEMSRRQYARSKAIIDEIRRNAECVDCGNPDDRVLDFDHVPERGKKLRNVTNASLGVIKREEELKKCDIVCANCHRIREYERREAKKMAKRLTE